MFKMLLASTALATMVTTSAMAASETTTSTATTTSGSETVVMTDKDAAMHMNNNLASNLIGSSVYGSSSEDADMIGDINDIVISPEGQVASVIVGVGGFLGIGEKDVAVEYKTIEWVERDGERWLVANMTREQLEAAPAFDRNTLYARRPVRRDHVQRDGCRRSRPRKTSKMATARLRRLRTGPSRPWALTARP
jgi:sporulation protein YlmC with PRC-barrel domain